MEQPKTVRIGIRISPELHKAIQEVATRERRKMSDMARLMIEEAVEQYVEEDKPTYLSNPTPCPPSAKAMPNAS